MLIRFTISLILCSAGSLVRSGISSCRDVKSGFDGVYLLDPVLASIPSFPATVIHRRFNGNVNFNRSWSEFKNGFGDLQGELWLGLEKMHQITRVGSHELLVLTKLRDGTTRTARFDRFAVGSEFNLYQLLIGRFVAGNLYSDFSKHNKTTFATFDKGGVGQYCAPMIGGGWWYSNCYYENWNLPFESNAWKMYEREARMLIRPL
ncbi:ficolin-1-like [Wyeomyia smithii]|uniref:ficolin-1-like n=1 Tax=Wyeomyia smithii TaxID=174621 RepID=UPI002467E81C|nr:ficolin-1-like [Wyeomyia smithii]